MLALLDGASPTRWPQWRSNTVLTGEQCGRNPSCNDAHLRRVFRQSWSAKAGSCAAELHRMKCYVLPVGVERNEMVTGAQKLMLRVACGRLAPRDGCSASLSDTEPHRARPGPSRPSSASGGPPARAARCGGVTNPTAEHRDAVGRSKAQ